jgi:2-keto-4-pentenoate hydratase/2-oxohepta-3-ene-1,7-dioic acid hydratase in catechol pathway
MRLVSFRGAGELRVGVLLDTEIADLGSTSTEWGRDMLAFLAGGEAALDAAAQAVDSGEHRLPLDSVTIEAPVPKPGKLLAVGLNYADHIAETGRQAPELPTFFNKQTTCVNRPGGPIHIPRASSSVDYEGELAFVVGRRCRHVRRDEAHRVIAGYTILDDVSVRDWQARAPTMILGKGWDTHGPMGPCLVTADELGDPHALDLRTWVNDELRQSSNTRHLIFDCFMLVETLSTMCTLEPGDVVSTGTPSGVGVAMRPPRYLQAGDVVRIEIDGVGVLENPVVDEPDDHHGLR